MSNFKQVFPALMVDQPAKRNGRIERFISAGHTKTEAVILDDAVMQGLRDALAALGAAVDTLTPTLVPSAMPAILDLAAMNTAGLCEVVTSAVFGGTRPTPDCDCESCAAMRALHGELDATEAAALAAAEPTRH